MGSSKSIFACDRSRVDTRLLDGLVSDEDRVISVFYYREIERIVRDMINDTGIFFPLWLIQASVVSWIENAGYHVWIVCKIQKSSGQIYYFTASKTAHFHVTEFSWTEAEAINRGKCSDKRIEYSKSKNVNFRTVSDLKRICQNQRGYDLVTDNCRDYADQIYNYLY